METRAEQLQVEANKQDHEERLAKRKELVHDLETLMDEKPKKEDITSTLEHFGFGMEKEFEHKTLEEMRESVFEVISSLKKDS